MCSKPNKILLISFILIFILTFNSLFNQDNVKPNCKAFSMAIDDVFQHIRYVKYEN